jgi:hypothetical protein
MDPGVAKQLAGMIEAQRWWENSTRSDRVLFWAGIYGFCAFVFWVTWKFWPLTLPIAMIISGWVGLVFFASKEYFNVRKELETPLVLLAVIVPVIMLFSLGC